MFFDRFKKDAAEPPAEPCGMPHACAELDSIPLPFSPLITELLAMHAHTRHLNWLSQREDCPEEFRLTARAVLKELLAAWSHQTGGDGTIDDLLLEPRTVRTADATDPREGRNPFG